jgi:hypothetical protein
MQVGSCIELGKRTGNPPFEHIVGHEMAAAFTRLQIAFSDQLLVGKHDGVAGDPQAFREHTA